MKLSWIALRSVSLLAISLFTLDPANAARMEDLYARSVKDINKQHGPTSSTLDVQTKARRHADMLSLEEESSFTLLKSSRDHVGTHYRYQQTFRGIPVYGATVALSEDLGGNLRVLSGRVGKDLAKDLTSIAAKLTPEQALAIAKNATLGAKNASAQTDQEKSEKTIYVDDKGVPHVAYLTSFFSAQPGPMAPSFIIDANTGEILKQWDDLRHTNANVSGPGGNTKVGQWEYDNTDRGYLWGSQVGTTCTLENPEAKTVDLNGSTGSSTTAHSFTCSRNTVRSINGAYSPLNDAHFGATTTYEMFTSYVNVAPWGSTTPVVRAHYGTNYLGAFYLNLGVYLGDGNGTTRHPYTSLDIVAHEIAHGFTALNAGLSNTQQAGGIDEAFSDMAGVAARYYSSNTYNWKHGDEVAIGTAAIRYMNDPTLDGNSIDHASDWVLNMDPHYSSGVYNKAFYLLATTSGWDPRKAFEIFARANRLYWSSFVTFDQAACFVEIAAEDLNYSTADVTAAFADVGVTTCSMRWSGIKELYSGSTEVTNDGKTIATGPEPSNGLFGMYARTNVTRNTGKRYYEVTITEQMAASLYAYSGTNCLMLHDVENYPNDMDDCGSGNWGISDFYADQDSEPDSAAHPSLRYNGVLVSSSPLDSWNITQGDTIGVAVDLDVGKIWYSKNGTWVGNPAAGTNPVFDESNYANADQQISGRTLSPHVKTAFQNFEVTIRGKAGDLLYSPPTGFSAWGD